eukprot:gene21365-15397_t
MTAVFNPAFVPGVSESVGVAVLNDDPPADFSSLDKRMWEWVDHDKHAQRSSSFTSAGFIASPRGQKITYVAGILNLGLVVFSALEPSGLHYGGWAAVGISMWILGLFISLQAHKTRIALKIFQYGLIPSFVCTVLATVCSCNCKSNGMVFCSKYQTFLQNETDVFPDNQPRECYEASFDPSTFDFLGAIHDVSGSGSGQADHLQQYNESIASALKPIVETCAARSFTAISCLIVVAFANGPGRHQLVGGLFGFGLDLVTDGIFNFIAREIGIVSVLMLLIGLFVLGAMFYTFYGRHAVIKAAYALIADDKKLYDEIWNEYTRSQPDGLAALEGCFAEMNFPRFKTEQACNTLAEMYQTALLVNPWFQGKVVGWSRALNRGYTDPPFIGMKKTERAIEKIRRTYFSIPSRLCDIIRGSIVVNTLGEAAELVRIIAADPSVRIVRAKNRLTNAFDSIASGGYRDLQFNLVLVGAELPSTTHPDLLEKCRGHVGEMQIH